MDHNGFGLGDALQYFWAGGAGIMGRVMYHAHLLQRGERKPIWWIVCDLLIALGMGWIVLGLGDWFDVSYSAVQSMAIMAGWAGPQLIDRIIAKSVDRISSKDPLDKG